MGSVGLEHKIIISGAETVLCPHCQQKFPLADDFSPPPTRKGARHADDVSPPTMRRSARYAGGVVCRSLVAADVERQELSKKREMQLTRLTGRMLAIVGDLQGIGQEALPQLDVIAALPLPADDEEPSEARA